MSFKKKGVLTGLVPVAPSKAPTALRGEGASVLARLVSNMVRVQGGTFLMGFTEEQREQDFLPDEKPVHRVTLSDFFIGRFEVTQKEWRTVMGNSPSFFRGEQLPVEQVSWEDCQAFIARLNALVAGLADALALRFRLPTEAEWEFAARGGTLSRGRRCPGSNKAGEVAWYLHNCRRPAREVGIESDDATYAPHEVGLKKPNELGLYDMGGNVWEWCADYYAPYVDAPQLNPLVAASAASLHRGADGEVPWHVARGGSWQNWPGRCRVCQRGYYPPHFHQSFLGLRLAATAAPPTPLPPPSPSASAG